MSGTASIAVGILMIFLFGIGYIVGRKKEEYYADS